MKERPLLPGQTYDTTEIIFLLKDNLIEGSNIEYGKIENCKIDTNLTSKTSRRVTSKKNDGNIENSIDLFNIDSKMGSNGVPRGVGGPLLMMIGDAMTPFERTGDPV